VYLQADEPGIRILALFPPAEFLIRVGGVRGELGRWLTVKQHFIGAVRGRDLVAVPLAGDQALLVGVILLSCPGAVRDFVDSAGTIEGEAIPLPRVIA
jgi:hypothetical protein